MYMFFSIYADIPVIPELEEQQEEDLTTRVASAPKYYTFIILFLKTDFYWNVNFAF